MSDVAISVQYHTGSGWQTAPAAVLGSPDLRAGLQPNGDDHPLAAALPSDVGCELTVRDSLLSDVPDQMPVNVTLTKDGISRTAFAGTVSQAKQSFLSGTWSLTCVGYQDLIATTKRDTPLFARKRAATATTATSNENPLSSSYAGGTINESLWACGGRPKAQAASYPNAAFYYHCDHALLAPPHSWIAGETLWNELLTLVEAAGGQLYQDLDGTVVYRQPLTLGNGTPTWTFSVDGAARGSMTRLKGVERHKATKYQITQIKSTYTPRYVDVPQDILDDTTSRILRPGTTVIELTPDQPLWSLAMTAPQFVDPACFHVVSYSGVVVPGGSSTWVHALSYTAQTITLTIINNLGVPLSLERIRFSGEPLRSATPGTITVGSGTRARTLDDNPYIQTARDAERRALIRLAAQSAGRYVVRGNAPFDPARGIGETVTLEIAAWGVNEKAVILGMQINNDWTVDYTILPVGSLPAQSDYYQIQTAAQPTTKKIGY